MKNRKDTRIQAKTTASCGMAAALSVVLMMLSSVIPIFGYIGPMFASVLLIPLMKNFGKGAAMCTWLVTALLILILGADKEAALFYIFFGYYPVLKTVLDRIPQGFFRRLCKFSFFLLSAILMDVLLVKILGITMEGELPAEQIQQLSQYGISSQTVVLAAEGIFCLMVTGTMAAFDVLLGRISGFRILNKKL